MLELSIYHPSLQAGKSPLGTLGSEQKYCHVYMLPMISASRGGNGMLVIGHLLNFYQKIFARHFLSQVPLGNTSYIFIECASLLGLCQSPVGTDCL